MRFRAFSRQQRRVLTWWCSAEGQSREAVICDGAVRSGKTLCMGLAFFLWATACFDRHGLRAVRQNHHGAAAQPAAGGAAYAGGAGVPVEGAGIPNRLTVRLGGKENTFYLFGGRDEGSAALIQGITLAGVLLDEAALMPRSFVEQACAPVLRAGEPDVVLLQPGAPGALVLQGVDFKGGGAAGALPPLHHGG